MPAAMAQPLAVLEPMKRQKSLELVFKGKYLYAALPPKLRLGGGLLN